MSFNDTLELITDEGTCSFSIFQISEIETLHQEGSIVVFSNADISDQESQEVFYGDAVQFLLDNVPTLVRRFQLLNFFSTGYTFDVLTELSDEGLDMSEHIHMWLRERNIMKEGLKQALVFYQKYPVLQLLAQNSEDMINSSSFQIPAHLIPTILAHDGDSKNLEIVVEPHANGISGNSDNHGSLVVDDNGEIILKLDQIGINSIKQLLHEIGAYYIIKELRKLPTYKPFSSDPGIQLIIDKLAVRYMLPFIDAIGNSEAFQQKYIRFQSTEHLLQPLKLSN